MTSNFFPLLLQLLLALGFAGFILVATHLIGPNRYSKIKMDTYECGAGYVGDARGQFAVKYYMTAILFIIFDVESVFLFPWAVSYRGLGWFGFVEMLVFLGILMYGLLYVWQKGALQWD